MSVFIRIAMSFILIRIRTGRMLPLAPPWLRLQLLRLLRGLWLFAFLRRRFPLVLASPFAVAVVAAVRRVRFAVRRCAAAVVVVVAGTGGTSWSEQESSGFVRINCNAELLDEDLRAALSRFALLRLGALARLLFWARFWRFRLPTGWLQFGLLLLLVQQLVLAHLGQRRQVSGVAVAAGAVHVQQDLLVGIDLRNNNPVVIAGADAAHSRTRLTLRKLRHWYVKWPEYPHFLQAARTTSLLAPLNDW